MKFNKTVYVLKKNHFGKLSNKIEYHSELSQLVTFSPNRKLPRHGWFYYKESFSSKLVEYLLCYLKTKHTSGIVFDPFCGIGTTLLTAKENGFESFGIDILPFAPFISNVKLQDYQNVSEIEKILSKIKLNDKKIQIPERYYLKKSYPQKTLEKLYKIKEVIDKIENNSARNLAKLALLSILVDTSHAKRDGGFLRYNKKKLPANVMSSFNEKINLILTDLKQTKLNSKSVGVKAIAKLGDARNYKLNKKISSMITSPPYLNRYDYTRNYALELSFEFVDDVELKQLRYNTFKSHVESRSPYHKAPSPILQENLELLRNSELTNPQIPDMVKGYFSDLYATLENVYSYSIDGSKHAFTLSTSRFSGIHFETDIILGELGRELGFKLDKILVTKLRGSSAQQGRKYGDIPLRESIVIFEK